MIVFKLYLKILFKHKIPLIAYLVVYAFLMFLLLSSSKPMQLEYSNYETNMAFIDYDNTEFTNSFKEYLDDYAKFIDIKENKLEDAFFYREISFILVIPEGFTDSFLNENPINLQYRAVPNEPSTYMLQTQINKYLNLAYVFLNNDLEYDNLNDAIKENLDLEITPVFPDEITSDYTYVNLYFNFSAYIIMVVFISIIGAIMVSFKPIDIKRRMDIGKITNKKMNLILILSNMLLGLAVLLFFIIFSIIIYGKLIFTSTGLLYLLNALIFTIPIIALAYLISVIFDSINIISAFGTIFSLGGAFITGIFIPQFLIDKNILKVAQIFPSYWYVRANESLAYHYQNNAYLEGIMVQGVFALIFIVLSLIISKKKRQSEV